MLETEVQVSVLLCSVYLLYLYKSTDTDTFSEEMTMLEAEVTNDDTSECLPVSRSTSCTCERVPVCEALSC